MFSCMKSSRNLVAYYNCLLSSRQNLRITTKPFTCWYKMRLCKTPLNLGISNCDSFKMMNLREKSDKIKKTVQKEIEEDDESDEEEGEEESDFIFKGDEVKTYGTQSTRIDKLLKVCFKISRRNIEDLFYQAKVRVNGKVLKKKSATANVGDVIDIIKGFVNDNPKLLNVNRIEILSFKDNPEKFGYSVKIKKSKSLIIENFD